MHSLIRFPASSTLFSDFQRDIASLFRDFNLEVIGTEKFPLYNFRYTEDKDLVIEMAVAGYSKDRLDVELIDNNTLIVKGEGRTDIPADTYTIQQISNRSFKKSFRLNRDVDVKDVSLEDGILTITVAVQGERENRKLFKPK